MGYISTLDFHRGNLPGDQFIDPPPYLNQGKIHLRLDVGGFVVTSFGLIIEKPLKGHVAACTPAISERIARIRR